MDDLKKSEKSLKYTMFAILQDTQINQTDRAFKYHYIILWWYSIIMD